MKSAAGHGELRKAVDDCAKARAYQDLFFVVHTLDAPLLVEQVPTDLTFAVTVLDGTRIAELTVRSGLVDWLIEKRS